MSKAVLIVDDSWTIRTMIRNALSRAGIEVAGEAKDGDEAVALFDRLKPALVTMDLNMPGMDGFEAIRKLRRKAPRARILVLSAVEQERLKSDLAALGVEAVIPKPFKPRDLVKTVKHLLDGN